MSKRSFAIGGALVALAAFIPSADAAALGGINPTASLSRGDARLPMTSSIGSVRTFSPDGHSFSPDGLQQHGKDHWKKPIDSDQGGDQDPPKKDPTKTTDQRSLDRLVQKDRIYSPYWHNPHHYGDGSTPPLACRGRPGGC